MKNFLVYHNPDTMHEPVTAVDANSIVTNKRVSAVEGSRVWLITGEGSPRTFFLRSYFLVDNVDVPKRSKFKTRISGHTGKVFDPMIPLGQEKWFEEFKRQQGNFAFGFQPIRDQQVITGLEKLANS